MDTKSEEKDSSEKTNCAVIIVGSVAFFFIITAVIVFAAAITYGFEPSKEQKLKREKLKLAEENERLLDREILRSIYAQQKFPLFNNDGLQIKPFAQGILKQIGKLSSFLEKL